MARETDEEFIGTTWGNLRVVGVSDKRYRTAKLYTCEYASEAGLLTTRLMTKGNIKSRGDKQPRTGGVHLTESEYFSKVLALAEVRGYKFLGFAEAFRGIETKLILRCDKHSRTWDSTSLALFIRKISGCRKCGNPLMLAKDREEQILGRIVEENLNYSFFGWAADYIGTHSKMILSCPDHGEFKPTVGSFLTIKSKCPGCVSGGFKPHKPSTLYVLHIGGISGDFVGFGITGNIKNRKATHKRNLSEHGLQITSEHYFHLTGQYAQELETKIRREFTITPQGINGFRREAVALSDFSSLLLFIEKEIAASGQGAIIQEQKFTRLSLWHGREDTFEFSNAQTVHSPCPLGL